jgi:transporter family-2 protein
MNGLVPIAAAILAGGLIAAQGPIYARFGASLGSPIAAAMLAFAVGAMALGALLFMLGAPVPRRAELAAVPLWVWAGGVIGGGVVLISMHAVPRLGVGGFAVCLILGQLAASTVYDRFGAFGLAPRDISPTHLAGLFLVALGAALVLWR